MTTSFRLLSTFILSVVLFSVPALSAQFGLNDVSLLLPLPEINGISTMLSPATVGAKGKLLPLDIYQKLPTLDDRFDGQTLYDNNFKVVGIRIDPCFTEGSSTVCRKQVRMMWQPLLALHGSTSTLDSAMHTFYEFNDLEWSAFVQKWASVAKGNLIQGLQINPTLKQEGYSGATWKAMQKILLDSCGEQNLVRVTGMRLSATRMWTFLGFDKATGTWLQMAIPHITSKAQSFVLLPDALFSLNEFQGTLAPVPQGETQLLNLVTNSQQYKARTSEGDIKTLMTRVSEFENPRLNNPGTIDCVSCHLAQTVSFWGQKNFSHWDWTNGFGQSRFASDMNLENNSVNPGNVNRTRAFGYFDADPIFSQRVINESAVVAKALNSAR